LIFSPLAFGTVEEWSLAVLEITAVLAFCILLSNQIRNKKALFHDIPGFTPLMLFLAYIAFQLIPLPPALVKIISPDTYTLYSETIGVTVPLTWLPLTIHKKATLMEFFRFSSYAAVYILTVQLLTDKKLLKKTIMTVIIFASAVSFFGILQHLLFNNKIYWIRELTAGGTPFGPYVNRNHYAGFMGMIFPLTLCAFLFYKPDFSYGSLRERIAFIFSQKITNIHILLGTASIIMALSIFLSLSRGGIMSLCLSMIFFGMILIFKTKKSRRGVLIILIFVLVLYAVGWFGWESIFQRFEKIRNVTGDIAEERLVVWNDSINIIKDFPVTGTGFGTFVAIYPKYSTRTGDGVVDHAHNDYIELLADGGIIAALLFAWFLITVFFRSFRVFLKRREPHSIYIFIGSITGLISILIHSFTDFNLHIGANGLYFFFLIGLTVSAAHTRFYEGEETYLKTVNLSYLKLIFGAMSVFLILSALFNSSLLTGQFYYSPLKGKSLEILRGSEALNDMKQSVRKALQFDPLEAQYQYDSARIERLLENNESAAEYFRKAVQLQPANAEYLQMYGLLLSELKKDTAADMLLQAGMKYDPQNTLRYQIYAPWLISRDRKDDGINYIKKAISMEPAKTRHYISIMVLNGLRDDEIRQAIPETYITYMHFADYLLNTGNDSGAETSYLRALEYTETEKAVNPSVFMKIYSYYRGKTLYDHALYVMKKGSEKFPDNVHIRLTTAQAYEEAGLAHQAIEHYKEALNLDPDNKRAQLRLEKLGKDSNEE
jgi:O-antigen ligase/Tfp pilus assembly protein PilF